ncbi:MAG: Hsp20/alpha crystallin family protein [Desulfocapsaceae bacterium]|nr:Hsp20/alpha crystallin family protein [Desulfocapsaceae bacterium]
MITRKMMGIPSMGWPLSFDEMERMARQMNWLTGGILGKPGTSMFSAKVFPAVNISEDKGNYYVRTELPGIWADDINLEITGRNLAISGERKIPSEGENARYHRKEREAGKFSRVISLPGDVEINSVEAKLTNGLLTITIAKAEAARPKQISVK